MKPKNKMGRWFVGILFSFVFLLPLSSEDMGWGGMVDRRDHLQRMAKRLGLSQEQVQEIEEIYKKSESKFKELQDSLHAKREELRKQIHEEVPDLKKIRSLLEEISRMKIDLRMIFMEDRLKIREILTEEQKAKQRELMKKHFQKMKERYKKLEKDCDCD